MTKREIQTLIQASYKEGQLNEEKVEEISRLLKRRDLKSYIRGIKLEEKKKEVTVALPTASVYNKSKEVIFDLFPGKHVHINQDELLMLGAKITTGDMVYEYTLKQKLEDFLDQLIETYDEE